MDLGITGKTALVLAATRGLGFGVAQALIQEGVNVFICGRNSESLDSALADLAQKGSGKAAGEVCDVSETAQLDRLLNECRKRFSSPDIVVFNNGGPPAGDPEEADIAEFARAFQSGFYSAIHIIRKTYPDMVKKEWGRILIISSLSVRQPLDSLILSNTTRSALQSYLKTMSRRLATKGVTINAILPGPHETDRMTELYRTLANQNNISINEARSLFLRDVPMKRTGTTAEFGALAAFLCSQHAAYITGQGIPHDGGSLRSTV